MALHGLDHVPVWSGFETVHLIVDFPFARQVWHERSGSMLLRTCNPPEDGDTFLNWWFKAKQLKVKAARKGLAGIVLLTAWMLWKHWNDCTLIWPSRVFLRCFCWSKPKHGTELAGGLVCTLYSQMIGRSSTTLTWRLSWNCRLTNKRTEQVDFSTHCFLCICPCA